MQLHPLQLGNLVNVIQTYICYLDCTNPKIIKNIGTNLMKTEDKSKRAETVGEYENVPEDINYYVENSRMAQQPEVTLWDFIDNRPDLEYIKFCEETGADLTTEIDASQLLLGTLPGIKEENFYEWCMNNQHTCMKKYYERRPYHKGINEFTLDLPMKCGYNHRNTCDYNWGLYGDSNEQLQECIGGKEAFDLIGLDYDTTLCRLLVYMPGQVLPMHYDYLGGWCRENSQLNPNMEKQVCDLGPIKRHLLMVSDWHWGHALQFANSWFPKWKAGEIYNLPIPIYHTSTNFGLKLKITLSLSGVQTHESKLPDGTFNALSY